MQHNEVRTLPISFDLKIQLGRGMAGGQAFLALRVYDKRQ